MVEFSSTTPSELTQNTKKIQIMVHGHVPFPSIVGILVDLGTFIEVVGALDDAVVIGLIGAFVG